MLFRKEWGLSLLLLVGLACNGNPSAKLRSERMDTAEEVSTTQPETQSLPAPPETQVVVDDIPLLAHGTHMVFGIRLPRGMMPIKRQDAVQRFEGTHPIDAVKKYLVKQLAGEVHIKPTQYGKGYMISSAFPKSAQADLHRIDTTRKMYNIKIFEGSLGGAAVEIWEAKPGDQYVAQVPDRHGSYNRSKNRMDRNRNEKVVPQIKYKSKQQRVKATFRTIDKLATGKPLTEEDYQSPYFTDL